MAQTERSSHAETRFKDDQKQIIQEFRKKDDETIVSKYFKGKFLGKGGFAKVYQITNIETKKVMAAKIIPKESLVKNRAKSKLFGEIKIHRSLHHFSIVSFEHVFEDNENVYILLEICDNQTLNELLRRRKRLTEFEASSYIAQILHGLKYLHKHKIIHRDLKLGNLFLTEKMEIKIGDFGLATKIEFEGEKKKTVCGTPNYIAPEILEANGHSYEVDIWSLGVILYTILIGKPPFETSDVQQTYKKIRMNSYSFPENCTISDAARSLITSVLNKDPTKRPSIDEILAAEFFQQGFFIPKILPISTLACPPTMHFINQYKSRPKNEINNQNIINNILSLNGNDCNQFIKKQKYFLQICNQENETRKKKIKKIQPSPKNLEQFVNPQQKNVISQTQTDPFLPPHKKQNSFSMGSSKLVKMTHTLQNYKSLALIEMFVLNHGLIIHNVMDLAIFFLMVGLVFILMIKLKLLLIKPKLIFIILINHPKEDKVSLGVLR